MRVVLVVGPSGSGKDSLLRGAREYFGETGSLGFVRRYITRPPDSNEDNYYIDPTGFALLKKLNFFISSWQAHGNHYGIPCHALGSTDSVDSHDLLLLSISRSAIVDFEQIHDTVTTIQIKVKEDVLRERLKGRGRENDQEIQKRLERAKQLVVARDLITFDNSIDLDRSRSNFNDLLEKLAPKTECRI